MRTSPVTDPEAVIDYESAPDTSHDPLNEFGQLSESDS
jgi:hypothetical protein